ncbi:hypothetical protein pipiens_017239 [Culex pipiens pipiens]|uniref:Monocarboxylate transporter n=1 Tax=Culex pipiens pipiens TaxID=38569 RepID=A0ABD1CHS6_CULPP
MGGLATMASGLYITEAYQFTYAAIFGLAIACFSALRSILVVDLMGLEKLTNAFGILCLFQGLAAAIGAPIAGFFTDLTWKLRRVVLLHQRSTHHHFSGLVLPIEHGQQVGKETCHE